MFREPLPDLDPSPVLTGEGLCGSAPSTWMSKRRRPPPDFPRSREMT